MIRFRKALLRIFPLFLALLLAPASTFACSCETYGVPRNDAKEYYTKKFDGAIFTGTVASIKHDPASDSGGVTYSELTINVDQYWLGVNGPKIVLLVPGPNTSCWLDWKNGQENFFIGSNYEGKLHFALCDRLNWKPSDSKADLTEYTTRLLGKPKSFPKPRNPKSERH
jgi:hypothetical protein